LALIHDPSIRSEGVVIGKESVQDIGQSPVLIGLSPKPPNKEANAVSMPTVVTALPSSGQISHLAQVDVNAATNGSLLITEKGQIIGMMVAGAHVDLPASVDITPVNSIVDFVGQHIPNYAPHQTTIVAGEENLLSSYAPQIVQVESFSHASASSHPKSKVASLAMIFSTTMRDNACLLCDGDGKVNCPAKGCANGAVAVDSNFQIRDPLTKGVKNVPTKLSRPCSACSGSGQVRCPACSNGTETFRMK
jgi:hypothetical protein